jgi:PAS domain S-box-containing protein
MEYEKLSKDELLQEIRKLSAIGRQYEVIFSTCYDGIALIEAESQKIIAANPALVKNLGYKPSEITNLHLIDLVAKDAQELAKYEINSLIRGDHDIVRSIKCISRTGLTVSFDH